MRWLLPFFLGSMAFNAFGQAPFIDINATSWWDNSVFVGAGYGQQYALPLDDAVDQFNFERPWRSERQGYVRHGYRLEGGFRVMRLRLDSAGTRFLRFSVVAGYQHYRRASGEDADRFVMRMDAGNIGLHFHKELRMPNRKRLRSMQFWLEGGLEYSYLSAYAAHPDDRENHTRSERYSANDSNLGFFTAFTMKDRAQGTPRHYDFTLGLHAIPSANYLPLSGGWHAADANRSGWLWQPTFTVRHHWTFRSLRVKRKAIRAARRADRE